MQDVHQGEGWLCRQLSGATCAPPLPQGMAEKPATWKKLSAVSQSSAHPSSMVVCMERSHHRQDEDETEVEMEDVAKGMQEYAE